MARLGLLLLGLVTGFAGAVLHQSWVWLLVTAVAGSATLVAAPARARVWWAVGFATAPLVLSWPRPEGDAVVSGTGGLLLACLVAAWLGISIASLLPGLPGASRSRPVAEESASVAPSS